MKTILDAVVRKVQTYRSCGMNRPAWLQKQVDAIHEGSIPKLLEGLQDELDALNKAEYENR